MCLCLLLTGSCLEVGFCFSLCSFELKLWLHSQSDDVGFHLTNQYILMLQLIDTKVYVPVMPFLLIFGQIWPKTGLFSKWAQQTNSRPSFLDSALNLDIGTAKTSDGSFS